MAWHRECFLEGDNHPTWIRVTSCLLQDRHRESSSVRFKYDSTFSNVRRRGRRPILKSRTKRGSPTALRPNRVADMWVSLR